MDGASLAADPRAYARRLVAAFAPKRHVGADLIGEDVRSAISVKKDAPEWFIHSLAPIGIAAGVGAGRVALRLHVNARNKVGAVWRKFSDGAVALALFCALAVLFSALPIRHARSAS